jgi:hypothetical protein
MAKRTPEEHLTKYVIDYYGRLMTRAESLAYRTFLVDAKIEHGYSPELLEDLRTSDPEALLLMRDGVDLFMLRVRERILREHQNRVVLNHCPKCGGLATTPRARQCRWCFFDWHHDEDRLSK